MYLFFHQIHLKGTISRVNMSLEEDAIYWTNCSKCRDDCKCSRLGLALEVVHREVAIKNSKLVERNSKLERLCEIMIKKVDELRSYNQTLRDQLAVKDASIRELTNNRSSNPLDKGLFNYISILESFIHKTHGPHDIVFDSGFEGVQVIKRI